MRNLIAPLVTALLLATPNLVLACVIFPHEPSHVFKYSDSLVLAQPLEISPAPDEAGRLKGESSYQQTVTWRVLKTWKGSLAEGDTFRTELKISRSDPCSGWGVVRDYEAKILHSMEGSSLELYYAVHVDSVAPQLDALKKDWAGE